MALAWFGLVHKVRTIALLLWISLFQTIPTNIHARILYLIN